MKFSDLKTGVPALGQAKIVYLSQKTSDGTGDDLNRLVDVRDLPASDPVTQALAAKIAKPGTAGTTGQVLAVAADGSMVWVTPASGGGGTGLNPVPVALTDGATVTPDASAADFFTLTVAGSRTTRQIAKPTGVAANQAKRLQIFFKQDATGGRLVTFASGITAFGDVDLAPNAVTQLTMTTVDGGTTWIVDGLGVAPGNNKLLGSNASGAPTAFDNVRQCAFVANGAPSANKQYPLLIAPFAGRIRSLRSYVEAGSISVTARIGTTAVGGLGPLSRQNDSVLVAATSANTFTAGQVLNIFVNSVTDLTGTWGVYLDLVQTA